jgi:hypothetical protein
MQKARSSRGGGQCPPLSHTVTPTPQKPVEGKRTKTDKEPMSTGEYSGHMRRIK